MCSIAAALSTKQMQSEMEPQGRAAGRGCRVPPQDSELGAARSSRVSSALMEKSRSVLKNPNQRERRLLEIHLDLRGCQLIGA